MHLQTKDLVRVRGIEQLSHGHMASREVSSPKSNPFDSLYRAPGRYQVAL